MPESSETHHQEIQHLLEACRIAGARQTMATIGQYFIQSIADATADTLIKRLIRTMQRSVPGLLADQGAKNLWDELCAQVQNDDSPFSELYSEHVLKLLEKLAADLPESERLAVWLVTYQGECFLDQAHEKIKVPAEVPVNNNEIANHLLQDVLNEATNYENSRIRVMTGR